MNEQEADRIIALVEEHNGGGMSVLEQTALRQSDGLPSMDFTETLRLLTEMVGSASAPRRIAAADVLHGSDRGKHVEASAEFQLLLGEARGVGLIGLRSQIGDRIRAEESIELRHSVLYRMSVSEIQQDMSDLRWAFIHAFESAKVAGGERPGLFAGARRVGLPMSTTDATIRPR